MLATLTIRPQPAASMSGSAARLHRKLPVRLTASTAGLKGYGYVAAYCAAKHGVIGLTRALAAEIARSGVTVNAVCPGYTQSDLLDASVANVVARTGRTAEEARAALAAGNPQGRILSPREVADSVRWLCGADAGSVHGQAIAVCGGEVMQ